MDDAVPPWETDEGFEELAQSYISVRTDHLLAELAELGVRVNVERDGDSGPDPDSDSAAPRVVVPAERIRFKTAAELGRDQPPKPEWAVYGLAAIGAITELAGKLKASGKTTFVAHLVYALVRGLPFLGFATRKTAVVWLTEERPSTFLETLKRAGLEASTDVHILHWHDVKGLPFPVVINAAVNRAIDVGAAVLIVDTVSQFAGLRGDCENHAGDALAAIEPLQMAAAEHLAVIATRHERKGGGEVGESGRGSSAFSGAVDIVLAIRRAEGQSRPSVRVLHSLSRYSETPESLVMELTPEGYVALGAEGTVAALETEEALRDRLPNEEGSAKTLDVLLDGLTVSRSVAQSVLKKLVDNNEIQKIGKGRKGNAYRYFLPVKDSAETQITGNGRKQNLYEG